jgi:hypothetical protein
MRINSFARRAVGFLFVAALAGSAGAAEMPKKITYAEHIKPIFRQHCFTCHDSSTAESDLVLETYAGVIAGGASGEVVVPGDSSGSRLFRLVSHMESPNMPPDGEKLSGDKLAMIQKWIDLGALENADSKARVKKKKDYALELSGGTGKPEGPPPMPENVLRAPVVHTPRAGAITALATSPWAPLAAVAGQRQVSLYNTDSGELLGVLPFSEGTPHVLRFSRNGSLLLVGGGRGAYSGKVAVFDVKTGKRVITVGDEYDVVLAADINNDHSLIALGGPKRMIRVYSTADGSLAYEIKKHTDWVTAIEFSPDGVLLATGGRGGGLFVWEAGTGREYLNLKGHKGQITSLSWRADSNVLASGSEDGTIRLWEMLDGKNIKDWRSHGGVFSVSYARDGRLVTAGRDKRVRVWDGGGKQLAQFPTMEGLALEARFTHDGKRVVAGDWLGNVRLWEVEGAKQVAALPANPPTLAMRVAQTASAVGTADEQVKKAAAELAAAEKAVQEKKAVQEQKLAAVKNAETALREAQAAGAAAEKAVAQKKRTAEAAGKKLAPVRDGADKSKALLAELQKQLADALGEKSGEAKGKVAAAVAAVDQAVAAAEAAHKTLAAEIPAAEKALAAAKANIEKATQAVAAAKKDAEGYAKTLAEAEKPLAEKRAAHEAAAKQAEAARAAAAAAVEEKQRFDRLPGELQAAAKSAGERLAAAQKASEAAEAALKQAIDALAAQEKPSAEAEAAVAEKRAAAEKLAEEMAVAQGKADEAAAALARFQEIQQIRAELSISAN